METKEYYLGLDLGTNSIGWCVTDQYYRIVRYKGKDLIGIREFDEADTSENRRTFRCERRRRQREVARLGLLKDFFWEEIEKKDNKFLIRLDNSFYHVEDKDDALLNNKYGLFNDPDFNDKDYFKKYPTIFHLRKELIENKEEHDIRFVYLAILNIFKHRGHFINSGDLNDEKIEILYENMINNIEEILDMKLSLNVSIEELIQLLSSDDYSRSTKQKMLLDYYHIDKKQKREIEILKVICGLKANGKVLFGLEEDVKIDFSSYTYDENAITIEEQVGEDNYVVIEAMKTFYDSIVLSKTLKGYDYLSQARCASYEKHKDDLKKLKALYKKYLSIDDYNHMFRSEDKGTYSAYVNTVNSQFLKENNKTVSRRNYKERKSEDLYKTIKKDLNKIEDCDDKKYILDEIAKETFLPKQLTASNGVIPNQVHSKELKAILNNAKEYLPFLNEKDDTGLTISDKIIQLFEFQIPYYVGPLGKDSKTGWVKRKEEGPILPWNINDKIDMKETSKSFIEKMVRKCTYISKENVHALPKNSLMYETYQVLNEINNIKISGRGMDVSLKQEIYNELYLTKKKVTKKAIFDYLKNKGILDDMSQIKGIDVNINNQLSSYHKFKTIIGDKIREDKYKRMVEDIIFWITVYGDKKLVKEEIVNKYNDYIDQNQLKKILALKFKDWGRLSKEFLELQGTNIRTGEHYSIIRMLWETNDNLMELLTEGKYTYLQELKNQEIKAHKLLSDFTYDDLDDSYFSAPVKRMVWQTILLIKELEQVLGNAPIKVFIEMTREHQSSHRTTSRKDKFLELYKNVVDEKNDWKQIINDADNNGKLKAKRMYLYLTQKGKCMYSGEDILLSELFNENLYDIDHIYPQCFVKDDNIDNNLVLVKKDLNNHKSDTYPLSHSIKSKCKGMWKELLDGKYITKEKYDRLTSNQELTDDQKAGFIARQLVETSQGTKGVATILENILPKESKIVYVKGSNVSSFRHRFDLYKSRILNDYHHAHDAYYNIIVGNVYYEKFTNNPINFIKKYKENKVKYHYNLGKMYDRDLIKNGNYIWKAPIKGGDQGTISFVKKTVKKVRPLMTRMSFEKGGQLSEATLISHKEVKEKGYLPLKTSNNQLLDISKYGGKTSIAAAYYFLVEYQKGKKRIRSLEIMPVYLKDKYKDHIDLLEQYCKEELELKDPQILLPKIPIQSYIKYNGYYLHISGKSDNRFEVRNAVNLILDDYWVDYIHKIEKYHDKNNLDQLLTKEDNEKLYDILTQKHLKTIYAIRPNPVGGKLEKGRDKFLLLDFKEQIKVLYEIVLLSKIGLIKSDLSTIGCNGDGKMRISKTVSNAKEFILIHQSVTGIYERYIDLLSDELANNSHIK